MMMMVMVDTGTVSVQLHREDQDDRSDLHDSVRPRLDRLVHTRQPSRDPSRDLDVTVHSTSSLAAVINATRQSSRVGDCRVRVRHQNSTASRQCTFVQQLSTSHWSVILNNGTAMPITRPRTLRHTHTHPHLHTHTHTHTHSLQTRSPVNQGPTRPPTNRHLWVVWWALD